MAGCLASFLIIEGLIISQMHVAGPDNLDYLIVLGAQVYKNGPSPVLKFRLDKAYEYLSANPETRCIVTGGQGSNEPFTEASCMADYLVKPVDKVELAAILEKLEKEFDRSY